MVPLGMWISLLDLVASGCLLEPVPLYLGNIVDSAPGDVLWRPLPTGF